MKKILIMTIGLWCLTSCTQESDYAPRILEVSAEIAPQTSTRTYTPDDTNYDKLKFDIDDEILIKKNNETAVAYEKGTNTWMPVVTGSSIAISGSNETFKAFYPTEAMQISEDQTSYIGFWSSKQLTSAGVLNGNKVTFSFTPSVAKISVVVSYDALQTSVTAQVTGTAVRGGSGSQIINLLQTSVSANKQRFSFAGIIAVGNYGASAYQIKLTDSSGTKSYTQSTALTLKAGYNYQYTFTSTNELILTGVTVLPFVDQNEEDSGSAT